MSIPFAEALKVRSASIRLILAVKAAIASRECRSAVITGLATAPTRPTRSLQQAAGGALPNRHDRPARGGSAPGAAGWRTCGQPRSLSRHRVRPLVLSVRAPAPRRRRGVGGDLPDRM